MAKVRTHSPSLTAFERLWSSPKSCLESQSKWKEERNKWHNDSQKKNESLERMLPFPLALNTQDGVRKTFILRARGIFKLSLFRISRVTTFPLIWFDYLSWSSEMVLFPSFQTKKVLSQMASNLRFSCRCHSFVLFLSPPLGLFNSASFQSNTNFLCVWVV